VTVVSAPFAETVAVLVPVGDAGDAGDGVACVPALEAPPESDPLLAWCEDELLAPPPFWWAAVALGPAWWWAFVAFVCVAGAPTSTLVASDPA
jgi:hypothetical protein